MNALTGLTAAEVIAELGLEPLADEGGFWKAAARTDAMNSIYFLMTDSAEGFSALHKLQITEGWQWVAGAEVEMLQISPAGEARTLQLNSRSTHSIVPINHWQAARSQGRWSLVTCWCAPAFEPAHFELGERNQLMAHFPHLAAEITRYTR